MDILREESASEDYNAVAKPWADKLMAERAGAEERPAVSESLMLDAKKRADIVFEKKAVRAWNKEADTLLHAEGRAGAIIEAPKYLRDDRCVFVRNVMVQDLKLDLGKAKVFRVFSTVIESLPEDGKKIRRDRLKAKIMAEMIA